MNMFQVLLMQTEEHHTVTDIIMNFYTYLPCQVSNEFLMPLCSNQFFNDLTQSWATSVTLYPKSKGMFDMLWFLHYTSPWLTRQESQKVTVKMEKQS